jgi:hypothetical protein
VTALARPAPPAEVAGLLFVGDPHLAPHVPGHRRDDYPAVALEKLRFCLEAAAREDRLPVLLGDLFEVPRENGNALVARVLRAIDERFPAGVHALVGNHDIAGRALEDADTLSVLVAAGRVRLLSREPWFGRVGGRPLLLGGTDWARAIPEAVDPLALGVPAEEAAGALVVWATHHDVRFAGYEEAARVAPREIEGVDLVVNGHIHRPLEPAACGRTLWCNPGNIARVRRGEGSRRAPAALRVDVADAPPRLRTSRLEVPHRPYEEVFHEDPFAAAAGEGGAAAAPGSSFVSGLEALLARRTSDGQTLTDFLTQNLSRFRDPVAAEVRRLAEEVLHG